MPHAEACPAPARPERGDARAPARAARRLSRLVRALHERGPTQTKHAARGAGGAASPSHASTAAAPWGTGTSSSTDDRACLAARALSLMLCDEPTAARCRAKALHRGAAAALWQCAVSVASSAPRPPPTALDGAGPRDRLAHAVTTALGDLLVFRGDDAVGAAALLIALDPRYAVWSSATVHASRPLRVVAAGIYLMWRNITSGGSCLGVTVGCPSPVGCQSSRRLPAAACLIVAFVSQWPV